MRNSKTQALVEPSRVFGCVSKSYPSNNRFQIMNCRNIGAHLLTKIFSSRNGGARIILTLVLASGITQCAVAQTGSDFRSPQDIDGSRSGQSPRQSAPAQVQSQSPTNQLSTQQAFDMLMKELDNLIPGDFEEGSAQKKAVEDAVTAFQLRDASRVIQILKAQAIADSDFPPTDLLLAGLSFATRDPQSGRTLLERAGMENPASPAIYSTFARLAINENRSVDALALLEKMGRLLAEAKLSEKSKRFYELQYLDGMVDVAMRQRRFSDARVFLAKQRELIPTNPKVLMVSAELEFKEANLDKSMEYLNQLRATIPQTRAPETIIASWFQRSGQKDDAKKWIADAATKYIDDPQVQMEVASWAVNEEDFPAAIASIKKSDASGETPLSKYLKAKIAFAGESYGVAEMHYKELYLKTPTDFDAANMYALSLIESSDASKRALALEIANRNFRSLPDNVVAQAALGYIQLRSGDLQQAKSAVGRALQTNAVSPEIRYFGASVLREMKQTSDAKTLLEQALAHQGIFLYRVAAKKMLEELNGELPAPKTDQ